MASFRLASPAPSTASFPVSQAPLSPPTTSSNYNSYDNYDDYDDYDDDEDDLPYPSELPRNDFLAPDFDAQTYLSTLRNRHQTLEDLRSDLRSRSQLLSSELVELVNGQYEAFLSLGGDLKGGEEKVEGVRVGVLGFEREVRNLWGSVKERELEVKRLLEEREIVRKDVVLGRGLLEVDERVRELESRMGLADREDEGDDGEGDEDEDDEDGDVTGVHVEGPSLKRLQRHSRQYIQFERLIERLGPSHPFLIGLQPRIQEIRKTLLLDLAFGLRQAKAAQAPDAIISIVRMYGDLGAEKESLKVLKGD